MNSNLKLKIFPRNKKCNYFLSASHFLAVFLQYLTFLLPIMDLLSLQEHFKQSAHLLQEKFLFLSALLLYKE